MKKLMITMAMIMTAAVMCHAQRFNVGHFKMVYTEVDSMKLESMPALFPTEDGSSLVSLPKETNLVVAYNSDRTKAIVLHGNPYARKVEFNVKDDEIRQILWYKDKHIYCGYIYDKRAKACSYFEAINRDERDMLSRRLPFLRNKATFKD